MEAVARTGSRTSVERLCLVMRLAITLMVSAEASMPELRLTSCKHQQSMYTKEGWIRSFIIEHHSHVRTCLDNIDTNILYASIDLLANELGRHDVHIPDAQCVLRRQSRSRRQGIAPMSSDDLLIGFKAAARGISTNVDDLSACPFKASKQAGCTRLTLHPSYQSRR